MPRDESQTALLSLSLANIDIGALLPSTGIAAVFLDREGRVKGFTPAVSEIWPLTQTHIGQRLDALPHRAFDMPPLPDLAFLTSRNQQIEHEVHTRDGRWYLRAVLPRRSPDGHVEGSVVTFVEITDRKRLEMRLVVEHTITRLLSDAESFRDVARDILQAIAVGLDAEFCGLWLLKRNPDRLSCSMMAPHEETRRLRDFQQATRSRSFVLGEGLPGRVWATRRPEWVTDIAEQSEFTRAEAALACGLHSAVAFPILSGRRLLGVVEFFTTRRLTRHPEWLDMMRNVGREIGEFIHRRQVDDRLRAEQLRNTAILESSLDCIITMDHEGKIVDFNPAAERTLGFAANDVVGRPLTEILIPERFRDQYREGFLHYLATGSATVIGQRLELAALRADGSEIPVEVAINVVTTGDGLPFFTGFLRDISERKQERRKQLRRQKIEYFLGKAGAELTASLIPEDVCSRVTQLCVPGLADWAVLDVIGPDGAVQRMDVACTEKRFDDVASRLKQYPPVPERGGHPPARALFSSEAVLISEFTEAHLHEAAQNAEHEQLLRQMNPTSFISVPLVARGATFGALTLARANSARRYGPDDVSVVEELAHRAAIAIDNARLYQQAEQANRAKSDFLANMSHEIRTPMTAVLGYADILAARITDPVCSEKISIIKRNGEFLLEIINDILDLSKIEAGRIEAELERFELAELVGDVLSLMQLRANEKGLELDLEYQTDAPEYIVSDPIRLRQILVNLVGNAVKFTETGSVRLVVRYDYERRRLLFDVVDTGIGISPALREALFEPFTQGDSAQNRKYGGTGLGLTISRRLAEMLGGTITVASNPGSGSTFTVDIDAGLGTAEIPMVKRGDSDIIIGRHVSPRRRLNCHVLAVDDREDIRQLARHFVSEAGGRVVTTCDGLQAIQAIHRAEREGDPFDIVLMDMQMPNLDGREATALLREENFRQPIIAITADAMEGDREKTLIAGCDGYLSKPIDRSQLISMIATFTQDMSLDELEERRSRGRVGALAPPMAVPAPMNADHSRSPPGPADDERPRVLIVDDWPDTSESMAELLDLAGFEAMTAENGELAIDTYLDWHPAAVLMDLGLPDMDGCEALRRMRQCAPLRETFFLAISGRDGQADIRRARKAGFHEYLVKPADLNTVISMLSERLNCTSVR